MGRLMSHLEEGGPAIGNDLFDLLERARIEGKAQIRAASMPAVFDLARRGQPGPLCTWSSGWEWDEDLELVYVSLHSPKIVLALSGDDDDEEDADFDEITPTREDFLEDVLTAVVEIVERDQFIPMLQWGTVTDVARRERRGDNYNAGVVTRIEVVENDTDRIYPVSPHVIERGIARLQVPGIRLSAFVRKEILLASATHDASCMDTDALDCLIEVALFGKLVQNHD